MSQGIHGDQPEPLVRLESSFNDDFDLNDSLTHVLDRTLVLIPISESNISKQGLNKRAQQVTVQVHQDPVLVQVPQENQNVKTPDESM